MSVSESIQAYQDGKYQILKDEKDTFKFGCKACGMCCTNNNDIIVSVHDIIKLSQGLKKHSSEISRKYLKFHVGQHTLMPIATLKMMQVPVPGHNVSICPFAKPHFSPVDKSFQGIRCSVHSFKPHNCAVFPLGKATKYKKDTHEIEAVEYFVQDIDCEADKTTENTLGDWIKGFSLEDSNEATAIMNGFIVEAKKAIEETGLNEMSDRIKSAFYNTFISALYGNYEPKKNADTIVESKRVHEEALAFVKESSQMAVSILKELQDLGLEKANK